MPRTQKSLLTACYRRLFNAFGPQYWWPGDTTFEIIIGAILTQNTNWTNVEKAIVNLKRERLLDPLALQHVSLKKLSLLIRPAGYFNVKARRLKNFLQFLFAEYQGQLSRLKKTPAVVLRRRLLNVNGIGPETADSILLYAFGKSVFVVDAYTKRFLVRHNIIGRRSDYHSIQALFEQNLTPNASYFNEYHALIVRLGKEYCRTTPRCERCPLRELQYSMGQRCCRCFRAFKGEEKRMKRGPGKQFCLDCDQVRQGSRH